MNQTTIGERIKYHRKRLGMTQEQLADRIGVSAQAVSKWENNLSCPDISILPELAALFGITVDELLGKNEPVHEAEPIGKDKGVEFNVSLGKGKKHGLLFAIYVIVFGALLLVNMLLPNPPSWWTVLWTTFLIYVGISSLCEQFSVFGTAATVIGLIFFVDAYHALPLPRIGWKIIIPVCLVLWGVSMLCDHYIKKNRKYRALLKHKGKEMHREYSCYDGMLRCDLSFGSYRAAVVTPELKGGSIDSSFGDFTVDFSACGCIAPGCRLDLENNFGSLTLLVPERYRVDVQQKNCSFGSFETKGEPAKNPDGTLLLNIDCSFGSVFVQYI